jgi:anti-sigma regulatory factor (Ser/Thr protein kinase)
MEPKDRRDVEVTVSAGPAAPARARSAVTGWLGGRVADAVLQDAVLLVSELVTNSTRHAKAPSAARIRVRGELEDHVVRLHVLDRGKQGAVAIRASAEPGPGGFGLQLVASLATRWGVRRGLGTEVWFELPAARCEMGAPNLAPGS